MEVDITQFSKVILISVLLFFLGTLSLNAQMLRGYQSKSVTIKNDTIFGTNNMGSDSVLYDTSSYLNIQSVIGNFTLSAYIDTVRDCQGVMAKVTRFEVQLADSANVGNTPFTADSIAFWASSADLDSIGFYPPDSTAVWFYQDVTIPHGRWARIITEIDTIYWDQADYYLFLKLRYQ